MTITLLKCIRLFLFYLKSIFVYKNNSTIKKYSFLILLNYHSCLSFFNNFFLIYENMRKCFFTVI